MKTPLPPHSRTGPLARLTGARTGNRRTSRVFGAGHDRRVGVFVADVLGRLPRNPEWSVESWCLYLSYISSFIGSRCLFFGRRSRPVRVRSTMAGALRGVPAVMGDGTRRAYRRVEQGRSLFPRLALVLLGFAGCIFLFHAFQVIRTLRPSHPARRRLLLAEAVPRTIRSVFPNHARRCWRGHTRRSAGSLQWGTRSGGGLS